MHAWRRPARLGPSDTRQERQGPMQGDTTPSAARAAHICNDPRWNAVINKDPAADGQFLFGVSTTGVYCRPSCGARRPRPENVSFFATTVEAEAAGFRPCRRCQPDQPPLAERHAALVAALCRHMEQAESPPSLESLAEQAGLSPWHVHRIFKSVTGLTPRQYALALRTTRLQAQLTGGKSVTDALHAAGFGSAAGFYAASTAALGMPPRRYRAGGADADIHYAIGHSSLGGVLVAASAAGICAISLGDDPDTLARELRSRFPRARLSQDDAAFAAQLAQVIALVEDPGSAPTLPLDIRGTAFQQRVWQALQAIPPGSTLSYTELAQRVGAPAAVRAVASACAANVLAVAIPCHRAVRNDGGLAGYRWGIARKRTLLDRESEE
jgi:AraC family transcriptional regulator of adaptative response/methylated-DNA-[protein]-cysteine methyltransferase